MKQGKPVRILHIEDDEAHAEIVLRNLRDFGIANTLTRLRDGQAALDYLFRRGEYSDPRSSPRPDLVLVDLRLPKVDGLEVLRRLSEDVELSAIPAVVLTTSDSEADVLSAYRRGAVSYLVKPLEFERFASLMRHFGFFWLLWNSYPTHGEGDA